MIEEKSVDCDELPVKSTNGIYHGWIIAIVSFLAVGGSIGFAHFGFGLFIVPLEKEFDWSRTQINFALILGIVVHLCSPLVGRIIDLFGSRYVMAISLLVIAMGFFLRSIMTDLWQFYIFSVLIFLGGPGGAMLPAGRLVGLWFPSIRGRMMGFVTAGNNFGGLVSIPILTIIISFGGWRIAFFATGVMLLAMSVLTYLFVKDKPDDVQKEIGKRWTPSGTTLQAIGKATTGLSVSEALRTRAFWLIGSGMTLQQFVRTTLVTQLAAHLVDVGFGASQIGASLSVLAFFGVTSKIVFGRLSEITTARWAYTLVIAIQVSGIGSFLFLSGSGFIPVFISLAVFGLGMGGVGTLGPLAVTEMFGLKNFGSISGFIRQGVIIPGIVGPLLAGYVYDRTGVYDLAFQIILGFLILSCLCFALARPPKPAGGSVSL